MAPGAACGGTQPLLTLSSVTGAGTRAAASFEQLLGLELPPALSPVWGGDPVTCIVLYCHILGLLEVTGPCLSPASPEKERRKVPVCP